MTILREPVDRVLSHYHFHLLGKRRGEVKLRETWEGLMNLDRLQRLHQEQPDASPSEIKVPEDALVSLEEGLARRITIYDNLATRLPLGRRVDLRRAAAGRAGTGEGERLALLVRRLRGAARRIRRAPRPSARDRSDGVSAAARQPEAPVAE